jgi:RND superfamily putative drug exporter
MSRFISTGGLAERCARRPWTTIIIWVIVAALAMFAASRLLGDALTAEMRFTRAPESQQGLELKHDRLTGPEKFNEIVVVSSADSTVDDAAFRQQVDAISGELSGLVPATIENAVSYYQTHDESMVSADRHSTIISVVLAGRLDEAENNAVTLKDALHAVQQPGMSVMDTGVASTNNDFNELAKSDGQRTETVGVVMALVVLVFVFGTLVAAGLPIALAGLAIFVAVGITALIGQKFQMSFFAVNMITMMGLAVGIDYTLFVVSRYREELEAGKDKYQAVQVAGATASKSVLFSGMTVILALLGMLLIPMSIFASLGAGAIFVVASAVAAALTLLPAVLGLIGHRVNSVRLPLVHRLSGSGQQNGRFWNWTTNAVMKRPLVSTLAVVVLLAIPALFYLQINTGASGIDALPDRFESKQAFLELERDFSLGLISPVEVVVEGDLGSDASRQAISRFQEEIKKDPQLYGSSQFQQNDAGDLGLLTLPITAAADSEKAVGAVKQLRQDFIPEFFSGSGLTVYVTGAPAINADYFNMTDNYRPVIFAFVLTLSFLLLMVVFRSLVVPLKAILMNLLSVSAAYGLIVLVFQKGVGAGLLGFHQVEAIEAWLPLFLFSVLFGLSMDYHVFLIGRIRERYIETGNNSEAVAFGLRSTGRIITGAALIMVAVFAGFASGELVMFQQMGFGLAVAVLLDATLIRSVLVPATMKLLGDRNWYLPRWLQWLPDLQLGEKHENAMAAAAASSNDSQPSAEGTGSTNQPTSTARMDTLPCAIPSTGNETGSSC